VRRVRRVPRFRIRDDPVDRPRDRLILRPVKGQRVHRGGDIGQLGKARLGDWNRQGLYARHEVAEPGARAADQPVELIPLAELVLHPDDQIAISAGGRGQTLATFCVELEVPRPWWRGENPSLWHVGAGSRSGGRPSA